MEEDKLKILDLGCGQRKQPNAIGIDIEAYRGVNVVMDLDKYNIHLPYKDGEIDGIYAIHFLEHIRHFYPLLNECHRVLKAVGFMDIIVPLGYVAAFSDPSHVRAFSEGTFAYFTENPPGGQPEEKLKGLFWRVEKNDWTPTFTEDTENIVFHKRRELHVIMRPSKQSL